MDIQKWGSFLGIKLYHTVEDVGVKSVTLAVEPVEGEHSADNLKGIVIAVANRFQVSDRILAMTMDNASMNSRLRTCYLTTAFSSSRIPSLDLAPLLTSSTRWKSTYYMLTQANYSWLPMTTFEQNSKT